MNSEDKADKLKLIKANQIGFRTNWETNQPLDGSQCDVLIKLQVNDKGWYLTPTYVRDPQALLEAILANQMDYINILRGEAAEVLYNTDAVIFITSSRKALEK